MARPPSRVTASQAAHEGSIPFTRLLLVSVVADMNECRWTLSDVMTISSDNPRHQSRVFCLLSVALSAEKRFAMAQCAKPTLTPPGVSGPVHSVTVTIKTATTGAYLRYTLDCSPPTEGPSGHGTKIAAASGKVSSLSGTRR